MAAVISDVEGRSCVLFLTAGLQPLSHVLWYNFDTLNGQPGQLVIWEHHSSSCACFPYPPTRR